MIKKNTLQFGITREDPLIEESLLRANNSKSILLICSGGDTVLHLKNLMPEISITAFDFNPRQIQHTKEKRDEQVVGNFESLFAQWKRFFNEFILDEEVTLKIFEGDQPFPESVFQSAWWPVSFDLHFHDSFLRTMFGEAAIQHAPKGSYPRYFQKVFERGLRQSQFSSNPFLQHIFFERYLCRPDYFNVTNLEDVELLTGTLFDVKNISRFDLVQLSNIFDWSSLEEITAICHYLRDNMKSGAMLLIRQINNEAPIQEILGSDFLCDKKLGDELYKMDRSLFYSNIIVARKL